MDNLKNILVVDDDKVLCEHIRAGLVEEGYNVAAVNKASLAVEEAKNNRFNIILTDLILPDISGIELLRLLIKINPDTAFIVFTGNATIPSVIEALKIGVYDYIIKPFDFEHLKLVIGRCIEKQDLLIKNKELFGHLQTEKTKLEIIMDAYNKITLILGLEELADFVADKALQIAEAEKASLMLIDDSGKELVLKGSKGLDKERVAIRVKLGELISGWVAQQGQALLVSDVDTDPRLGRFAKNIRPGYKTKSFVSLPMKLGEDVIGVMNVTDKLSRIEIFTEEDLKYLSLLAYQTVAQIQNIRLCEKLASMAATDALTGLFNHRYFQELIDTEIRRSQRYKHRLSMIMLDVDFFKTYNDDYGHLEGDRVLKCVADIFTRNVRQVDIVCRYGGDEFVIVLVDTDIEGAKKLAEKIRSFVETQDFSGLAADKKGNKITISCGLAEYKQSWTKNDFIAKIDGALYKAKSEGRNRICIAE